MKDDSGDAKKHTKEEISPGFPNLPSGTSLSIIFLTVEGSFLIFSDQIDPSNNILPGVIAFILTPFLPNGLDIDLT